ncbi:MAG: hypothetical protein HUJ29_09495 [Gammaproteobacteria bacterium]|nr:hypothetical protein [Gammaproteobacteria bacterium]
MNAIKSLILVTLLGLAAPAAMAGGNHGHSNGHSHSHAPIDQGTAQTSAARIVGVLAKRGELDGSWSGTNAARVEKTPYKGQEAWVVVFENTAIAEPSKQTLYIFLTLGGDFIVANYTGK